jgi:hypothetical protein
VSGARSVGRSVAGYSHPFRFLAFVLLQPVCLPACLPATAAAAALFWSVGCLHSAHYPTVVVHLHLLSCHHHPAAHCWCVARISWSPPPPRPSAPLLPPLSASSSSFFPSCTFRFLTVGLYFLQLASEQQVFHLLWSVRSTHTHTLSLSLSL